MHSIIEKREEIYNYFHESSECQEFFFSSSEETRYSAYYTSMYLLQDTTESLIEHRKNGFSSNPYKSYIEFWGVMQALIIQQDSIRELYHAVTADKLKTTHLSSWQSIRHFRNVCAGHPVNKRGSQNAPIKRTFMGRNFGGYSRISYELWEKNKGFSHSHEKLGLLIDNYSIEASEQLDKILQLMKKQWFKHPTTKCT